MSATYRQNIREKGFLLEPPEWCTRWVFLGCNNIGVQGEVHLAGLYVNLIR